MESDIIKLLFPFKRNVLVGELKLQSCEEANIFYATHIMSDENLNIGDYSQKGLFKASSFTHQNKTEEDIVIVDADSTILQGIYRDKIGELSKQSYEYVVTVYVWVEIEEEEEKKGGNK